MVAYLAEWECNHISKKIVLIISRNSEPPGLCQPSKALS
jgi:hypothetical protein